LYSAAIVKAGKLVLLVRNTSALPDYEVHVAPIHHVEGAGLHGQDVEHVHIVQLAVADVDEGWNSPAQVQQRVQLDGRFGRAKRRPLEQAQTQIEVG
jgi:hypothetical protein